jgi:hypothetical protein
LQADLAKSSFGSSPLWQSHKIDPKNKKKIYINSILNQKLTLKKKRKEKKLGVIPTLAKI